jgi:hypothetical protein
MSTLGCDAVSFSLRTNVSEERIAFIIMFTIIGVLRSVLRSLVTTNVVPSSPVLVTLMMECLHSSVTLVLKGATRHNIPEDDILHSHRRENLKSYIALTAWAL